MGYDSTYDAVSDLHDPEAAWDEVVTEGDRESLNVAQESVGRHANSQETAVRIADFETGETLSYSFAALNDAANRVGNYLAEHTARADRVAAMLPPRIELYAAIFGTVKAGRIYVPLTPLFGPEALSYRLADSGTSVLFLAREYADAFPDEAFPDLERVVVVDGPGSDTPEAGIDGEFAVDGYDRVRAHEADFKTVDTHPDDIYTLKYTSGTTGQPKGVPTRHRRIVHGSGYNDYVVDLRPEDNYFVAASPAWSYGLGATMSVGVRDTGIATYRGSFDPVSFLETLEEFEVTNLMCPPTALRQVRGADVDPREYDTDVRVLVSAGEALDEESVAWCDEVFGTKPLDAYGQTEAGMLLCNYSFEDWEVKPGSAGKPLPGMRVTLLDEAGNEVDDGDIGEICVRRSDVSAGTTRVYWGNPDETVRTYQGQWYRTGDLARRDEDGYYWYVSRKDEVIISAGYRIGPEEVQEALVKHDAVEEAGVVGIPDETRGEVVKAYVTVAESATPGEGLADDIREFARSELSKHEYPREVEFVDDLPKTSSGKIKRRELESS
jgi:acetyl-CoA synthetase